VVCGGDSEWRPSDAVKHTFNWIQANTSLSVFVKFAVDGCGDDNRLYSAVQARGKDAARELMLYLTDLYTKANCSTVEQFVIGYVPLRPAATDQLAAWETFLSETFAVMLIAYDKKADRTHEFGERLISLIRNTAEFADPRLSAWGV
jgi:hypothetical protein